MAKVKIKEKAAVTVTIKLTYQEAANLAYLLYVGVGGKAARGRYGLIGDLGLSGQLQALVSIHDANVQINREDSKEFGHIVLDSA